MAEYEILRDIVSNLHTHLLIAGCGKQVMVIWYTVWIDPGIYAGYIDRCELAHTFCAREACHKIMSE